MQCNGQPICDFPRHGNLRPFIPVGALESIDEARKAVLGQSGSLDHSEDSIHRRAGKAIVNSFGYLIPCFADSHRNSRARTTFALRIRSRDE
jgi:hypothetical protein